MPSLSELNVRALSSFLLFAIDFGLCTAARDLCARLFKNDGGELSAASGYSLAHFVLFCPALHVYPLRFDEERGHYFW